MSANSQRTVSDYYAARKIIAAFLGEICPIHTEKENESAASAIIARLTDNDPPLFVMSLPEDVKDAGAETSSCGRNWPAWPMPSLPIAKGDCKLCGWPWPWHGMEDVCPKPGDDGEPSVPTYLNPAYFSAEEEERYAAGRNG